MVKAFLELLKLAAKYGTKVVSFLKSAYSVIMKYGSAGIDWVKNNWGKVITAIASFNDVVDFINWIAEQLRNFFGF